VLYRFFDSLGKHATLFLASGVFIGFAVPPLAHSARPLLLPAMIIPLTLALVRIDWGALAGYGRNPLLLFGVLAWLLFASPVLTWCAAAALGVPAGLNEGLTLMAASAPIFSGAALALILGLDAALAIVVIVLATALVPFTLPTLVLTLLGLQLEIGLAAFMLRLAAIVGGAFAAAWIVRRCVRADALRRHGRLLDGVSVALLVVFAIAIMDGLTAYAFARPGFVIGATLAAFAANLLLQMFGALAFLRLGLQRALTVGLLSGNCNMGLVLVALADKASFEVLVFFGVAQVPMYMLPALLAPLYRRLTGRGAPAAAAPRTP